MEYNSESRPSGRICSDCRLFYWQIGINTIKKRKGRIMKFWKTFLLAVLAGMAIAIGGVVYLTMENRIVGSVAFSVGLYAICVHGLNLFTGKIGYLANQTKEEFLPYMGFVGTVWLGNFVGTAGSGLILSATRINGIAETANAVCRVKTADSFWSLLVLGIFCGMLMYIAVEGYKICQNPLVLVFCVAVFILCGFEHCIADMFYFAMAGMFTGSALYVLIVVTIGNTIGGMLIPFVKRIVKE